MDKKNSIQEKYQQNFIWAVGIVLIVVLQIKAWHNNPECNFVALGFAIMNFYLVNM